MEQTARAITVAIALIACLARAGTRESEQLARMQFGEAKNRERQHYYHDAIMFYKQVIEQVPGSELAKRAQERITILRATPEMIADAAKEAERKRKQAEAREAARRRLEEYVQAHPEYGKEILAHQVTPGMSQDDVVASWGKPEHVNTTITASGRHEQWVYGNQYVYFDDGRVSAVQSSR
jgi:hypothetical protein